MKLFLWFAVVAFGFLSLACAGSVNTADKPGGNKVDGNSSSGSANDNNVNVTNASVNPKSAAVADSFIALPSPNPVENGKKQNYTGITIDVPADWKTLKKFDGGTTSGISFQSPGGEAEAIKVMVGRSYEAEQRDMQTVFLRTAEQKIYSKIMLKEVNGTLGILYIDMKEDGNSRDYLRWETFLPPDLKGYALKRYVQFFFPKGSYEQNKQQIIDILYSAKIEN